MNRFTFLALASAGGVVLSGCGSGDAQHQPASDAGSWGASVAGDQVGNAKTIGPETWARCAAELSRPGAKAYELSHIRSNTMPNSPFGAPLEYSFRGTLGVPGARHAFNGETVSGEPASQGTQIDALGHFGYLDESWAGEGDFPADDVKYFGGFTQNDVKPTADSPLLRLGVENIPPLVTSAVLLDARAHNGGEALGAGDLVTRADIEGMLEAQGLAERGLLPGDVLYIHTGWSAKWTDTASDPEYYAMGPGLSYDAARHVGERGVALVSLDVPFIDPVNRGQLSGEAGPAQGSPDGLPFVIHHHNLTQAGVLQIENSRLADLAEDKVWLSCTMILPLRIEGGSGSPVRPVAIGAPAE